MAVLFRLAHGQQQEDTTHVVSSFMSLAVLNIITNFMKSPSAPETWSLDKIREKNLGISYPIIFVHLSAHSSLSFTGHESSSPFFSPLIFSTGRGLNAQLTKHTPQPPQTMLSTALLLQKLGQTLPCLSDSFEQLPTGTTMFSLWLKCL